MATFFSPAMLAEDRRRAGWSVEQAARRARPRCGSPGDERRGRPRGFGWSSSFAGGRRTVRPDAQRAKPSSSVTTRRSTVIPTSTKLCPASAARESNSFRSPFMQIRYPYERRRSSRPKVQNFLLRDARRGPAADRLVGRAGGAPAGQRATRGDCVLRRTTQGSPPSPTRTRFPRRQASQGRAIRPST